MASPLAASAALRLADTRAGRRALLLAAALVAGVALTGAAALLTLLSSTASLLAPPMTAAPSGTALAEIPSAYLSLYLAAARTYAIPWNVLAAIGWVESRHGSNPASSPAGAVGPMQFLPATFATYGVATGPRRPDIADPADAIYSAANYLAANGAADPDRLPAALFAYNHSPTYVHLVLAKASEYAATPPPDTEMVPAAGDVQAVMDLAAQGRISLPPEAAADLPSTDPRLVTLMLEIGQRHSYTVSVIRTGHARCVDATGDGPGCRESNHYPGRALDITIVDGQPISPTSTAARDLVGWLASLTGPLRPDEVGSPWANPTTPGYYWSDPAHANHVHLGYAGPTGGS